MDYHQETAWDLRLNLFGTPIRVHPMFWIVTVILGWDLFTSTNDLSLLVAWVLAVFFSILLHEMGHVLMGNYFGTTGFIILHGFGGLAIGSNHLSNRWKRIAVSLAGPGIQLVLYFLIIGLLSTNLLPKPETELTRKFNEFLSLLLYINFYWPFLNLLPVFPLDGGQALKDFLGGLLRNGDKIAYIISSLFAILAVLYFASTQNYFLVFLFLMMAIQNFENVRRA